MFYKEDIDMSYEFVSKNEYTPVRILLEEIIFEIQNKMKPEYTFQFSLIGSGRKKLITREVGSNKGFDFDYNFSLQKIKSDYDGAQAIRENFFEIIQQVANDFGYQTEDNKSAITIKLVDQNNSRIVHSCDFGIVEDYVDNSGDDRQRIIVRDKNMLSTTYVWNERPKSKNYSVKLSNIEAAGLWEVLKTEYIKLKNNNKDIEKKSYQLFIEAISNVYNQYDWQN
jgi:hypothetical protein